MRKHWKRIVGTAIGFSMVLAVIWYAKRERPRMPMPVSVLSQANDDGSANQDVMAFNDVDLVQELTPVPKVKPTTKLSPRWREVFEDDASPIVSVTVLVKHLKERTGEPPPSQIVTRLKSGEDKKPRFVLDEDIRTVWETKDVPQDVLLEAVRKAHPKVKIVSGDKQLAQVELVGDPQSGMLEIKIYAKRWLHIRFAGTAIVRDMDAALAAARILAKAKGIELGKGQPKGMLTGRNEFRIFLD